MPVKFLLSYGPTSGWPLHIQTVSCDHRRHSISLLCLKATFTGPLMKVCPPNGAAEWQLINDSCRVCAWENSRESWSLKLRQKKKCLCFCFSVKFVPPEQDVLSDQVTWAALYSTSISHRSPVWLTLLVIFFYSIITLNIWCKLLAAQQVHVRLKLQLFELTLDEKYKTRLNKTHSFITFLW